ncbi:MAG: sigma-54 interaction domain-containing protein [Bacillota bacterium]
MESQYAAKDMKKEDILLSQYFITMLRKLFDPIPISIILIDKETRILMINREFTDFLGVNAEEIIGKKVAEVDPNTRFPYVFKSKKAELSWKHKFSNGHTAIVHRIPILDDDGQVLFGFGMVLFGDVEDFKDIIKKNRLLEDEISHYKAQLRMVYGTKYSWDNIIGESEKITQAKYFGKKAANTDSTVLLLGESGTGKELFAHAIHNGSKRSSNPFVKVNCAAIPNELLESELFGYEEGAFTGAKKGGKTGKFELASEGTIFLDEIGDMPMSMQVKLLRVLQEKEIEKIGSNKTQKINSRVIAATNKELKKLVQQGKFREDLFYRLNVVTIEIPSLRDRMYDIEALCMNLLDKITIRLGKYVTSISETAMDYLRSYQWPGNVRELENVLERAVNIVDGEVILPMHLPVYIVKKKAGSQTGPVRDLKLLIEEVEKEAILKCLEHTKGNKQQAAKLLNISRSSLYEKMEKYLIETK